MRTFSVVSIFLCKGNNTRYVPGISSEYIIKTLVFDLKCFELFNANFLFCFYYRVIFCKLLLKYFEISTEFIIVIPQFVSQMFILKWLLNKRLSRSIFIFSIYRKENEGVISFSRYFCFSLGGSDDGINVAVALEVLRKISQSAVKPRNNIIFLFNGAEEMGLLGSHGFITKHKWRDEVKVLINLEATGAGGREILFQTGPGQPWLLKYYDVPHPHANAGGEEIFQSGIVPSDTDFRIFGVYGNVVGTYFYFI